MKIVILLLFVLNLEYICVRSFAQGVQFDDNRYQQTKRMSLALKFAPVPQSSLSLRQFCPRPLHQGQIGSCVGWAAGYSALTMTWAIEKKLTDMESINRIARSPLFIFNQIRGQGDDCDVGVYFEDAFEYLKTAGTCSLSDFNPSDCHVLPNDEHKKKALEFRIGDYYRLFDMAATSENKVAIVVNTLASKRPVVVGLKIPLSFTSVPLSGYWLPSVSEPLIQSKNGGAIGHAVCVIGYDNVKRRFELVNSWGTNWGKAGFFSMSYDDFGRYCKYAYQMVLPFQNQLNKNLQLTGHFTIRKIYPDVTNTHLAFSDLPVSFYGGYYHLTTESVKIGDYFRIFASGMQPSSYVYILSIKPDNSVEMLFPTSFKTGDKVISDVAIVPSSSASIQIPINDDEVMQSDQSGDDYICILYSTEKIHDIVKVINGISTQRTEILDRLRGILGERMVKENRVKYKMDSMNFQSPVSNASIVPLILKISVAE